MVPSWVLGAQHLHPKTLIKTLSPHYGPDNQDRRGVPTAQNATGSYSQLSRCLAQWFCGPHRPLTNRAEGVDEADIQEPRAGSARCPVNGTSNLLVPHVIAATVFISLPWAIPSLPCRALGFYLAACILNLSNPGHCISLAVSFVN
jgi:hypothetical protein